MKLNSIKDKIFDNSNDLFITNLFNLEEKFSKKPIQILNIFIWDKIYITCDNIDFNVQLTEKINRLRNPR